MNPVSLNCAFTAKNFEKQSVSHNLNNSNSSIFTPAPSSAETAGSVASSAPSSGSFSAAC